MFAFRIGFCVQAPDPFMSELDVAKEQIAYLKVWLGVLVITDISVFGWLISNLGTATAPLRWGAVIAVVALTAGIFLLHRRIKRHIESLRGLYTWKSSSLRCWLSSHSSS